MSMRSVFWLALIAAGTGGLVAGCSQQSGENQPQAASQESAQTPMATPAAMTHDQMVARGRYLVAVGSCNDCHSPKVFTAEGGVFPDSTRLLSGHPADSPLPHFDPASVGPGKWTLFNDDFTACVGPWGVTFSQNLTPDTETGTGSWPKEMFIQALRTGKHLGSGRPIMPPMPWPSLAQASDEDLGAIYEFLHSLPPISNKVPDPIPWAELVAQQSQKK